MHDLQQDQQRRDPWRRFAVRSLRIRGLDAPETLKAGSTVVGLPVMISLAQEIAHMNVQLDEEMGLKTLDDLMPESRQS